MIKIILADDNAILKRHIVESVSQEPDMQVVGEASCGKDAFDIAKTTDFDIAVLDIDMETSTAGIVAAGEILAIKPDAKIIFLTVHEDDETVLGAMSAGNVDYVVKSDDMSVIIAHIRSFACGRPMALEGNVANTVRREFLRLRRTEDNLLYFIKNLSGLTTTEKQLVQLLLQNKTARQIADERTVELTTVKTQISHILKKCHAKRTKELVEAIREKQLEELLFD